uniref:Uncharacterized protein n=1 Tax=Oryza sativa subsp. japonica TaxID=39947 RepID=Q8LGV3_ORYSJ|nr:hypothetical protein [Oryza sativa Japonica Group]BAD30576.1 hypothetical protein [Oryza sativa Japonica Group]
MDEIGSVNWRWTSSIRSGSPPPMVAGSTGALHAIATAGADVFLEDELWADPYYHASTLASRRHCCARTDCPCSSFAPAWVGSATRGSRDVEATALEGWGLGMESSSSGAMSLDAGCDTASLSKSMERPPPWSRQAHHQGCRSNVAMAPSCAVALTATGSCSTKKASAPDWVEDWRKKVKLTAGSHM